MSDRPTNSSDNNAAIARLIASSFESGSVAPIRQFVAEELLDHNARAGAGAGRAGLLEDIAMYRRAFKDLVVHLDFEDSCGELVIHGGRMSGLHVGDALGVPGTGRTVSFSFLDVYRFRDGEVVEIWHLEDLAGLMRQLGGIPWNPWLVGRAT